MQDTAHYKSVWVIRKYNKYEDYLNGNRPYEISEFEGNLLLNEGITRLQNLLIGGGGTTFNNAGAWLGVGVSSGTASATDTGLLGASLAYRPMEATYPQIASQTSTWRSIF